MLRKPPLSWLRTGAKAVRDVVTASPLLAGLAGTAAVLLILFFVGLSLIGRSPTGRETTLTNATELISQGRVSQATLLDQDAAITLRTLSGEKLWANYPSSNSYTGTLLTQLQHRRVPTTV